MSTTYVKTVPNPPQKPSANVQDMQNNASAIYNIWSKDHFTFDAANPGLHNQVTFPLNSSPAANVAPSATSGVPLVSGGSSANPSFTTAVVAGGGTGATSFNINGPVISNTTTTGALSSVTLNNQKFLVGNTSAAPTSKGLSIVRQVFGVDGTYTPTSGMLYCDIEVVGGGGGGGGVSGAGATTVTTGGGGGGGGYAKGLFSAGTIGASQTVSIGAGGGGGGAPGSTGGTTSVGALISATGGVGGAGGTAIQQYFLGGAGGAGSGGDYQTNGTPGTCGINPISTGAFAGSGGDGGSSFFGGGARGPIATGSGNAGLSYGGGGSGAICIGNNGGQTGGAGFSGGVFITEYVIS